jgi:hypothetical protein
VPERLGGGIPSDPARCLGLGDGLRQRPDEWLDDSRITAIRERFRPLHDGPKEAIAKAIGHFHAPAQEFAQLRWGDMGEDADMGVARSKFALSSRQNFKRL